MWCNLIHSLAGRCPLAMRFFHCPSLPLALYNLAPPAPRVPVQVSVNAGSHEHNLNDLGKKLGIITVCHLKNDHILSLFRASCHTDSLVPSWCVTRIGFVTLRLSIRSIWRWWSGGVLACVQILAKETGCFTVTEIVETLVALVLCDRPVALKIAVRKT